MNLSHFHLLKSILVLVRLLDQYTKLIEPFHRKVLFHLTDIFSWERQNNSISVSLHILCMKMPSILAAYFSRDIWIDHSIFFQLLFLILLRCYTQGVAEKFFLLYFSSREICFFQLWAAAEFRWVSKPRKQWNFVTIRERSSTKKTPAWNIRKSLKINI